MEASLPAKEADRLEALRTCRILDAPPEQALDDITQLAAHLCAAPVAFITFVGAERRWFKSRVGWTDAEASREAAFCSHAIQAAGELVVPDASRDARFRDHPLVKSEPPAVRFYAGFPLIDAAGRALGALCVVDRISRSLTVGQLEAMRSLRRAVVRELETRRQRAELEILGQSEARYRQLAESSPDAIFVHSGGRIVFANRAMADLLGAASAADLVGKPATFMVEGPQIELSRARIQALYAGKPQPRAEKMYVRLDGGRVQVEIAAAPLRFAGRPAAHVTVRDISGRRAMQQRAQVALERFEIVARATNDAVWDWDLVAHTVWWNPTFFQLFGYRPGEVEPGPESWYQRIHPQDRERVVREIHRVIDASDGQSWTDEYRFRRGDGSYADIWDRGFVLRDGNGAAVRMIGAMVDVTGRKAAESGMRRALAGLSRAQSMAKLAHVVTRPDGGFSSWSETFLPLVGLASGEMPADIRGWLERIHPEDREKVRDALIESGAAGKPMAVEYRFRRGDGAWICIRQEGEPIGEERDAEGRPSWFGTMQDITEQKSAEERIRRLTRVHAMLSAINAAIIRIREPQEILEEAVRIAAQAGGFPIAWIGLADYAQGRIRVVASGGVVTDFFEIAPPAFLSLREDAWVAGRSVTTMTPLAVNDVRTDERVRMKDALIQRNIHAFAMIPLVAGGRASGVLGLCAAEPGFFDEEEMRLLGQLAGDVSFALETIEKSAQLDYLAYYDTLTGLANRTLFLERIKEHLAEAARSGRMVALTLLDLERFKPVNDALGRQAGDELLRQVAGRLSAITGAARIARVGADLFAVMTYDLDSADDMARRTERRIPELFAEPFRVGGSDLRAAAKFGIALFPADGAGADELFRNAEAALKKAKATGERYLFYAQEMNGRVADKLALETRMRNALEREEFVLHYQPKMDAASRRLAGVEALIRWKSPDLGLVPPMEFIPLLEETGLILEAGAWALRRAAGDYRAWRAAGLEAPRIAVNISPIQLRRRDFVAAIQAAVAGDGEPGIDLEITETLAMEEVHASMEKLGRLRELGFGIAIDDFGTGYSSLAYLARLPVHTLKIDRSFVITMLKDRNTATLVQVIISLAHSIGLKTVAEGVDSEEQAKALLELGCDQMQGFLFGRPVPFEEIEARLRRPY